MVEVIVATEEVPWRPGQRLANLPKANRAVVSLLRTDLLTVRMDLDGDGS
jgi:hypothetical protein